MLYRFAEESTTFWASARDSGIFRIGSDEAEYMTRLNLCFSLAQYMDVDKGSDQN